MPPYNSHSDNGVTLPSKLKLLGIQRSNYFDLLFFYRTLGNSVLGYSLDFSEMFKR
jgi:hypothetical protein